MGAGSAFTYIATLGAVYALVGHHPPHGMSTLGFLATGIVPYINFYVRIQSAVSTAVRSNVSLLYFRGVTPLVLITAAVLREFLTSLVVFVIIIAAIAFYDDSLQINDPLTILAALSCISLLGMIVGAFFGLAELAAPAIKLMRDRVDTRHVLFLRCAFFAEHASSADPSMGIA